MRAPPAAHVQTVDFRNTFFRGRAEQAFGCSRAYRGIIFFQIRDIFTWICLESTRSVVHGDSPSPHTLPAASNVQEVRLGTIPAAPTPPSARRKMHRFGKLFANNAAAARRCRVIGMVHVDALPGTPLYTGNFQRTIDKALQETEIYLTAGIDSILIENMHDIPYTQAKDIGPEITAAMTRICSEIKQIATNSLPLGLQILAGGNKQALAVAKAANFDFIRAEGFVFGHLADEGYTDACAGDLLRYRKQIDAEHVLVFTDIKKKHSSHAMTSDVSLVETAKAAEFFLTDGVILTGTATGDPASPKELQALQEGCSVPVLVGSGVTFDNFKEYSTADACIIGSYFKSNGRWQNALDGDRIKQFMNLVHQ